MMTPLEEGSRGEGTFAKDGRGERISGGGNHDIFFLPLFGGGGGRKGDEMKVGREGKKS